MNRFPSPASSAFLPVVVGIIALLSGRFAWADEAKPAKESAEVKVVRDLAYYEGEKADKVKHKLDLFLPRDRKDFPVLFFVHGGAWQTGDKNYFGVYSAIGMLFARNGIGAVVTNYRLSPTVQHPEHIKDVAKAFAWTHKNIKEYGGRPDQLFVCGHSAGGHLAALLATDEKYLKAEGLSLKTIKGAVPMSGVYTIPPGMFTKVFGTDEEIRKAAAPVVHACADCPPFLIIYADKDFLFCDKMSEDFCKALKEKKCQAEVLEIKKRNHISIIVNTGVDDDPAPQAILRFIATHTAK